MTLPHYLIPHTTISSAYAQKGDSQIFFREKELSLFQDRLDVILNSLTFSTFFQSLDKSMANIDIKVIGKDIYLCHERQTMKVKTAEELEELDEDKAPLKPHYIQERASLETSASRIDSLKNELLQGIDETLTEKSSPHMIIDLNLTPSPHLNDEKPKPQPRKINVSEERKTSRKKIFLEWQRAQLRQKQAPNQTQDLISYFQSLDLTDQENIIKNSFKPHSLKEKGEQFYNNLTFSGRASYFQWSYEDIAVHTIKTDSKLLQSHLNSLKDKIKSHFEMSKKKEIQKLNERIQQEKNYLKQEANSLNSSQNIRKGQLSLTSDNTYNFLSGQSPIFIPGVNAVLQKLTSDDERIKTLKEQNSEQIYYDDLLYLLRNELKLITKQDGSIDRSKALFFSSEYQFIQYLFPLKESAEGLPKEDFLTDETIDLISHSQTAQDNISVALSLVYEFYGLTYSDEKITLIDTEEASLLPFLDKKEYQRIARLLLFSKDLSQKMTIQDHKNLFITLLDLSKKHPNIKEAFKDLSAMGTDETPGSWRLILA